MTQQDCLNALNKGRTLVNQYGTEVHLDKYGQQVRFNHLGKRTSRPYSFHNAHFWSIKPNLWNKFVPVYIVLAIGIVLTGLSMLIKY